MISANQFSVMYAICKNQIHSQRDIANKSKVGLSTVNKVLEELSECGFIKNYQLTDLGRSELDKFKVKNAVIMAAGLSSRFAPLSLEKPKGLYRVKGEVLIERQIRQLQEAGIDNITVVVGYMKEKFFYLEDKFHVEIAINEEYMFRNNNSTLYLVKEKLENTYICSSDNYFIENVFESHVYQSYYSSVYAEGVTNEYCLRIGRKNRIDGVTVGGKDEWIMLGHVYFSASFSQKFTEILIREYNQPGVAKMLWEDIYIKHIDELDLYIKRYDKDLVLEFDTIDDIRLFDNEFISNVDSKILKNIASVLHCMEGDIRNFVALKKGLTNLTFKFGCNGKHYLYRHPGIGTEAIINRASEAYSQKIAYDLGIDDTFIYMDPSEGWKISRFIEDANELNYHNDSEIKEALGLIKKLHDAKLTSLYDFDILTEIEKLISLIENMNYSFYDDFSEIKSQIFLLAELTKGDGIAKILCHNDCYSPNFITNNNRMYLIDWEYSGNADPASDLGTFICCSDYTLEKAMDILSVYFGRELTLTEQCHYIGYIAIAAFYWFVWALYKESLGEQLGNYTYLWYKYAREFGQIAGKLYENNQSRVSMQNGVC